MFFSMSMIQIVLMFMVGMFGLVSILQLSVPDFVHQLPNTVRFSLTGFNSLSN